MAGTGMKEKEVKKQIEMGRTEIKREI